MLKIGISGAMGRMGECLRVATQKNMSTEIGGLVEKSGSEYIGKIVNGIKVSDSLSDLSNIDVLIDFSTPERGLSNLEICATYGKPIVVGTTGLDDSFFKTAADISKRIPVLISSNMSIGVNAVHEILKTAARLLYDYDVEIVEKHHRYKKDAPSGTAISLARTLLEQKGGDSSDLVYERHGVKLSERKQNQIGIQSVRAGNIVGEHEIIFASNEEVIKVSHNAGSRMIFALGALKAAIYLKDKKPGLYTMKQVLGL